MSSINISGVSALIPPEHSREILQNIPQKSKTLSLMKRLPDFGSTEVNRPVLNSLPTAYFINPGYNDEGVPNLKKTTKVDWGNLKITAEEIACIVPIGINMLRDAQYPIWEEVKPLIEEAFGVVIDQAVLFGTNAPESWASGIVPTAIAKGNVIEIGTNLDVASDIIGENGIEDLVNQDGYNVTGFFAASTMKAKLRDLRTTDNALLYAPPLSAGMPSTIDGLPVEYDTQGVFDTDEALLIGGDFTKAVYAIRQDMEFDVLKEAVIQDPSTKEIMYNFAQQDMVGLRCTMRLGVQVANPVNRMNSNANTRYPFAVLTPASGSGS